jgi:hypothetical protein
MKIRSLEKHAGSPDFVIFCPACRCGHGIWTTNKNEVNNALWTFDGNMDRPTISPSILVRHTDFNGKDVVCHSFVNNGMIQFLGDCSHEMAGKTLELPEF